LETELLDILINNIGSLSSVYYKPPEQFVKHMRDNVNSNELEENVNNNFMKLSVFFLCFELLCLVLQEGLEAGEDFLKP